MSPTISIAQGAATVFVTSLAIGGATLALLRARLRPGELFPAALACGTPLMAALCAVLLRSGHFRRGTINAAAILALLLAAALARRLKIERAGPPPWYAMAFLVVPLLACAYFPLLYLAAPDLTPPGDDSTLALARRLCEGAHNAAWDAAPLWAAAYRFGAHSAAAALHFLFLPSLALLIFSGVRRFSTTQAAVIAALLTCTAPAALLFSSRAGTQLITWFCACATVWLAALAVKTSQFQLIVPALLAGLFAAQMAPLRGEAFPGFIYLHLPWALIPMAALALGWLLRRQTAAATAILAFHLVTSFPLIAPHLAAHDAKLLPPHPARHGDQKAWLAARLPGYDEALYVEEFVPPGGAILTGQLLPEARLGRRLAPVSFLRILDAVVDERSRPSRLRIVHLPPDPRRRFQIPPGGSIAEIRFYIWGTELPRSSAWLVRASSGEPCAPLAFDNSLVTLCACAVEIDFGGETVFDEVRITGTQGEPTPVPAGLRRAAVQELRHRGVTHLFLPAVSSISADLSTHAQYWGVTEIGERNGAILFQLD